MKVAGVIVTYNRKELLTKNIDMQIAQSRRVDKLYIIDNHSTDGTKEHIKEKYNEYMGVIEYIYLSENTGGAGGFYYGTQIAYKNGYDYIWLMDDDGRPLNSETLKNLLDNANELYKKNKHLFLNSLVTENGEKLTFGFSMRMDKERQWDYVKSLLPDTQVIFGHVNPFNGTLLTRELVADIGYPNKDFFIERDEMDYLIRAKDINALIATVITSEYHHLYNSKNTRDIRIGKVVIPVFYSVDKQYYWTRNMTYSYKKKHKLRLIVNLFLQAICIAIFQNEKVKRLRDWKKAIIDALCGRMGKRQQLKES